MQHECRIRRRYQPKQLRIQEAQRFEVDLHRFRHQTQIERMARLHVVGAQRLLRIHLYAITRGILRDQRERENDGHIIARLFRQRIHFVELPEIRVTGALDSVLHGAWARIVRGHHQIPVAEHLVQVSQMVRRRARGFLRILPVIHPPAMLEPILLAAERHELPQAPRTGTGQRLRLERALSLRHVD